jgi:hypothetical protein
LTIINLSETKHEKGNQNLKKRAKIQKLNAA